MGVVQNFFLCFILLTSPLVNAQATEMTASAYAFYIGIPIIITLLYFILAFYTWPMARSRSYLPFYTLLFIFLIPPGFFLWWFWIFLLASPSYLYYPKVYQVREVKEVQVNTV